MRPPLSAPCTSAAMQATALSGAPFLPERVSLHDEVRGAFSSRIHIHLSRNRHVLILPSMA